MKTPFLLSLSFVALFACKSKETVSATITPPPAGVSTPPSPPPLPVFRPENGVYEPGETELAEIRRKDSTVTMAKLQEGYHIYTRGACVNCHGPANIYQHDDASWPGLLADMSMRARITDAQQDAVYKYILSIRAVKSAGK